MMTLFLRLLFAVWLAAVSGSNNNNNNNNKRPNIVFVLADDYGFNDIGYHSPDISTPVLDQLATEGVRLENYYVQPICSPTRSQFMSGRYQIRMGLQHGLINSGQASALPRDSPTLADKMREAGYATHLVGKWHLGYYKQEFLPFNRGFDTFYGYLTACENYTSHKRVYPQDGVAYLDLRDNNGPIHNENGHYSTHLFTEKAINVVQAHDTSKPLFMYLAYQSVHDPLMVPEEYEKKYSHIKDEKRRIYAGMVAAMDEGVGNVTKALKDKGIWDNTILVFSTDNGGQVYGGGNNFPLRGHKHTLWDGGMHGVGFVTGGKMPVKGLVNNELIHVTDWYPTLVNLAKGSLNGTKPLDGIDQWDTITAGKPSRRTVLLHNIDQLFPKRGVPLYNDTFDTSVRAAVRVGDMKLITGDPGDAKWWPLPGQKVDFDISDERHKHPNKNVWLFNITADPNERHDLSHQMPGTVRSLLRYLVKFNAESVPPVWPTHDWRSNPSRHGGVYGPWM
ncbi:arylsulfatase B [Aplysia californica]|uniref:Arylsulfatase B n=1 Tax=Aplysia californica TaxID=6500 RepID=A0ABM1A233_APLCA|nr:arylsulfatase B [Aplysia californica]